MPDTASHTENGKDRTERKASLAQSDYLGFLLLAVLTGAVTAYGVIAFDYAFRAVQWLFYGFSHENVSAAAGALAWWHLLLAPTVGGLLIGLFVYYAVPGRRACGPVDVLHAVLEDNGRISVRQGLGSVVASAASIGVGASVGLYGPVVHLGASLGSWLARKFRMAHNSALTLLGCGVSAAIAASFNAPIAGVIFAHEVVLGHYALNSFAPITIASVVGTAIMRFHMGDAFTFPVSATEIRFLYEYPLFALVGFLSAIIAIIYMRGMALAEGLAEKIPAPPWVRPMAGGFMVGLIALAFPQVLGLGNDSIKAALDNLFPLWLLLALIAAKILATSLSIGFGFGGGVFGPSLFLGSMLGAAAGTVFNDLALGAVSDPQIYTLVGMGALISCVIGAPITTILIVFEMTSSYSVTTAVMVGVVIANLTSSRFFAPSFFLYQLQQRGVDPNEGREIKILKSQRITDIMSTKIYSVPPTMAFSELETILLSTQVRRGGGGSGCVPASSGNPPGERSGASGNQQPGSPAAPPFPDRRKDRGEFRQRRFLYQDLYVVGEDGVFLGQITMFDVAQARREKDTEHITAGMLASPPSLIMEADTDLKEAMHQLSKFVGISVPIVDDRKSNKMVGVIYESMIIDTYNQALAQARAEERGID